MGTSTKMSTLPPSQPGGGPLMDPPEKLFIEMPQLLFCAGDKLPKCVDKPLTVVTKDEEYVFAGGSVLPEDFPGSIFVDPVSGKCSYTEASEGQTGLIKAGETLPSFDGFMEVYTPDGEVQVFGGESTPDDMIGAVICVKGQLCYIGHPPMQVIPDEVQCGGPAPALDSGVEVWIDQGVAKYPTADGWVQTKPYGA